jgi:hypothetical protein
MFYEPVNILVQGLSRTLVSGKEFFAVILGKRGEPIRLMGPFEVLDREDEVITFVESDPNKSDEEVLEGAITVTIYDLVLCFDRVVQIKPRHHGTPQEGTSVMFSIMDQKK